MRTAMLLLAITASPAFARWDVQTFTDKMTDRRETFATVTLPNAQFYVGCLNGRVQPRVVFPERVGFSRIGATYRFDDAPPRSIFLSVSGSDGRAIYMPDSVSLATVRRASRLRFQVGNTFLDFDLTGAKEAVANIRCQ